MKVVLAIIVLVVFALSLLADYKWRRWMAQRRADQPTPSADSPSSRRERL